MECGRLNAELFANVIGLSRTMTPTRTKQIASSTVSTGQMVRGYLDWCVLSFKSYFW